MVDEADDDATGSTAGDGPVRIERDAGVLELRLDAPANRNALSAPLVAALTDELDRADRDPDVRVVVLGHTGSTFCSGADLAEAAREGGPEAGTRRLVALLRRMLTCRTPIIAVVDGHVRAGGLGLLGACDLVIAGGASTFAFTESRLGLAPAIISLTVSPRIDQRSASRWYLTGAAFGPDEAERMGLITAASTDPRADLRALLDEFRATSPQGLAETKALTVAPLLTAFDERADDLTRLSARLFASEEAREGIAAFRERRRPRWHLDG